MRLILPALILVAARTCMACDCNTLSASDSFKRADFVFVGEVLTDDKSVSSTTFTFRVDQVLKGTESQSAAVTSAMSDCDVDFHTGYAYIVYARKSDDRFIAPSCMSTRVLDISTQQKRSFVHYTAPPRYGYTAIVIGVVILLTLAIGYIVGRSHSRVT